MVAETPETSSNELPVGETVAARAGVAPARDKSYCGRYVTLKPVEPEDDVAELYEGSHGSEDKRRVWTYMSNGPFSDAGAMLQWLNNCQASVDPLFLTVYAREPKRRRVGMVSFLNIVPDMRRLELGHIWYSPSEQRTKVNTESVYLMLCAAFDTHAYRRVEWKCDALNARSRAAARRLGFSFEGIFKKHLVVKQRNRDTAWYAIVDSDWPLVKQNMEQWLYLGKENVSLTELNRKFLRPQLQDS